MNPMKLTKFKPLLCTLCLCLSLTACSTIPLNVPLTDHSLGKGSSWQIGANHQKDYRKDYRKDYKINKIDQRTYTNQPFSWWQEIGLIVIIGLLMPSWLSWYKWWKEVKRKNRRKKRPRGDEGK